MLKFLVSVHMDYSFFTNQTRLLKPVKSSLKHCRTIQLDFVLEDFCLFDHIRAFYTLIAHYFCCEIWLLILLFNHQHLSAW